MKRETFVRHSHFSSFFAKNISRDQLNFQDAPNDLARQQDPTSNILNNDNQEASEWAVKRQTKGKQVARIKPEHTGGQARRARVARCLQTFIPRGTRADRRNGRALRGERGTFYVLDED